MLCPLTFLSQSHADPPEHGQQPTTPEHRAALLKKLPRNLKKALEYQFTKRLSVGLVPLGDEPGPNQLSEDAFWLRVAEQANLQKVMDDGGQSPGHAQCRVC